MALEKIQQIRFIKLGTAGGKEDDCIQKGEIALSFQEVDHGQDEEGIKKPIWN